MMQTEAIHPKLKDAETLERCAKTIDKLVNQGGELRDRLELVYMALRREREEPEGAALPLIGSEISTGYLKNRALELRKEVEEELAEKAKQRSFNFPGPMDGPEAPKDLNAFVNDVRELARETEIAAESANAAKTPETRGAFVRAMFKSANRLVGRCRRAGLDGEQ